VPCSYICSLLEYYSVLTGCYKLFRSSLQLSSLEWCCFSCYNLKMEAVWTSKRTATDEQTEKGHTRKAINSLVCFLYCCLITGERMTRYQTFSKPMHPQPAIKFHHSYPRKMFGRVRRQ
jgi:hypothetical protein